MTVTVAPMPALISAALLPATPAAEDHDVGGRHAGNAAEQHAAAAVLLLQAARSHVRRHAAGDLGQSGSAGAGRLAATSPSRTRWR